MQFRFIIKTAGHLYRTVNGAIIGPRHQTDGKPAANRWQIRPVCPCLFTPVRLPLPACWQQTVAKPALVLLSAAAHSHGK